MADVIQFPQKQKAQPASTASDEHLHMTMQSIAECLNIFKSAHPAVPNTQLFGALMLLVVKNESRLEKGATPEKLLEICRKHLAKER